MKPLLTPATAALLGRTHGSRAGYMAGCRCVRCRSGNSKYETERVVERKAGDGKVPAARARKHLLALKQAGIGRRLVSEASGVGRTAIQLIRSGKKQFIRARTERQILSVDRKVKSAATLVPAAATWKLIAKLLEEGFTKGQLAKRLGYKGAALQFNAKFVTARTEQRVERFYNQIMEGA